MTAPLYCHSNTLMTDMSAPVLALTDLSKTFGRRGGAVKAVRGVSLAVGAGEVYGFLGPNGAGKSTTIRMLIGLIAPTAGTVELFGRDLAADPSLLRRVGSLVDGGAFYPFLSGRRNLEVLARTHGGGAERIDALLDQVGLAKDAKRKVKAYSTGMRQRLGVAAALLGDPEIVILDEPVNGLDVAGIQEMRRLIRSLAADHDKTVVPLQPPAQRGPAGLRPRRHHPQGRGGPRIDGFGPARPGDDEPQGRGRAGRRGAKRRSARTGRWSGRARRSRSLPREPRRRRWRAGWSRPESHLFELAPVQRNLEDVFLALTQEDPADA